MTISKPEVSTGSTLCLLVLTLCPRNINIYINHKKLSELEDKLSYKCRRAGQLVLDLQQQSFIPYQVPAVSRLHCSPKVLYLSTEIVFSTFCSEIEDQTFVKGAIRLHSLLSALLSGRIVTSHISLGEGREGKTSKGLSTITAG